MRDSETEICLFDGYIFDLDGTIYRGDRLIPGASDTIAFLRGLGRRLVFLSNKPLENREDYAAKLTRLGIPTDPADVINSSYVMASYLSGISPGCRVYAIGEPPLIRELKKAGLIVVDDPAAVGYTVDYVVAAFDRTFDYNKLNCAFQAIKRGAHFVATNADRSCPVEGGEIPDAAGMIGAIEGTTGRKVEVVVGKPSKITVEIALKRLGLAASDCLMVGDRLETDMVMGINAGMKTALVLTGVTTRADLEHSNIRPDFVLDSVADLVPKKTGC